MPVHDWTRVDAGIFHHFHHGWIEEIARGLNRGILPADYYAMYQQRIEAVTKDDVAKAARERLHPDAMCIVVVGPEKEIAPKIEALKLGKLEVRDADGEARKAARAAAGGK